MKTHTPAEVFPPGEFLKDELEARGWSQTDLADIVGRGITVINEILSAKRGITPDTAQALGDAFGSSAQFWLNLETAYRLSLVSHDDVVSRRARLRAKAPYREMIRRHWIEDSKSIDILERQLLDFLEISELDEEPKFAHAARKSTSYDDHPTAPQIAWLCRARQLVPAVTCNSYSKSRLPKLVEELRALAEAPENVRHVPRLLAGWGIRFLMIEPLTGTKIDGASFTFEGSPVIVLSLRYDRIDHFWHTLMHELGHISRGDGLILDQEIVSDKGPLMGEKPAIELLADEFAVNALIPQDRMKDFVIRVRPLFSSLRIRQFAKTMKIHPGIVVGQLQHNHEISYANLRKLLVPVRQIIVGAALTDGWGSQLPVLTEAKE